MKTVLRNTKTGRYFYGIDEWGNEYKQAFNFRIIERAVRFARDAGLKMHELELVLAFDDPGLNINLAINRYSDMLPIREGPAMQRPDQTL